MTGRVGVNQPVLPFRVWQAGSGRLVALGRATTLAGANEVMWMFFAARPLA